jgi:hypothetical protein
MNVSRVVARLARTSAVRSTACARRLCSPALSCSTVRTVSPLSNTSVIKTPFSTNALSQYKAKATTVTSSVVANSGMYLLLKDSQPVVSCGQCTRTTFFFLFFFLVVCAYQCSLYLTLSILSTQYRAAMFACFVSFIFVTDLDLFYMRMFDTVHFHWHTFMSVYLMLFVARSLSYSEQTRDISTGRG